MMFVVDADVVLVEMRQEFNQFMMSARYDGDVFGRRT